MRYLRDCEKNIYKTNKLGKLFAKYLNSPKKAILVTILVLIPQIIIIVSHGIEKNLILNDYTYSSCILDNIYSIEYNYVFYW